MSTPFTGGCACGAIRYECSTEPVMSLNCHCRDCQRASGSAYASAIAVPTASFRLLKGTPKYYSVKADSGHTTSRGFCPECGSPVLGKITEEPDIMVIQAGSLDDPSGHQPSMDLFLSSAQPWDFMNPALPKFEKGPQE